MSPQSLPIGTIEAFANEMEQSYARARGGSQLEHHAAGLRDIARAELERRLR